MATLCLIRHSFRPFNCLPTLSSTSKPVLQGKLQKCRTSLCATLVGKETRDTNPQYYERIEPWPYKQYNFRWHSQVWEGTLKRFNSNTKIIMVEGPIGAGKTEFAKKLAADFDMMYIPEANLDMFYIDMYGFDIRDIDDEIATIYPRQTSASIEKFYKNPYDLYHSWKMQTNIYQVRHAQYCDALLHLLNTGQGVVLDRSAFSDGVFVEAMRRMGYLSKEAARFLRDLRDETVWELLKPHLIVYLDIPPELSLERVKKRANPMEVNSVVFKNADYVREIDRVYKTQFLNEMKKETEIAIYDWSNYGDVEMVVEELERIDFDSKMALRKFTDWNWQKDSRFGEYRIKYDLSERIWLDNKFNNCDATDVEERWPASFDLVRQVYLVKEEWRYRKWYTGDNHMRGSFFGTGKTPGKVYCTAEWGAINNCIGY